MDVTAIAATATQMSQARTANDVQLTVFRKALDLQAQGAAQLIDAAAQATPAIPPNLGNRIDTFA
jgi:hypothetical protein